MFPAPRAQILSPTPENVRLAAEALRRGDVVGMPTETVYGLAGVAFLPEALTRIFETKERPTFDPLIVHVPREWNTLDALERGKLIDPSSLSARARARIEILLREFWPGPLTLVLPKTSQVPDLATSGLPTVALRMPSHPVAQALLEATGSPLAAPSANRFGRISPTTAEHVLSELGDRISYILDGGPCQVGLESTIVSVSLEGTITLLRPGGLPKERIEEAISDKVESTMRVASDGTPTPVPGMLESHYAPGKPLHLLPSRPPLGSVRRIGLLTFHSDPATAARTLAESLGLPFTAVEIRALDPGDHLRQAARDLFTALRELDASDAEILFAECPPTTEGLGHALLDRLTRAAAPR